MTDHGYIAALAFSVCLFFQMFLSTHLRSLNMKPVLLLCVDVGQAQLLSGKLFFQSHVPLSFNWTAGPQQRTEIPPRKP